MSVTITFALPAGPGIGGKKKGGGMPCLGCDRDLLVTVLYADDTVHVDLAVYALCTEVSSCFWLHGVSEVSSDLQLGMWHEHFPCWSCVCDTWCCYCAEAWRPLQSALLLAGQACWHVTKCAGCTTGTACFSCEWLHGRPVLYNKTAWLYLVMRSDTCPFVCML